MGSLVALPENLGLGPSTYMVLTALCHSSLRRPDSQPLLTSAGAWHSQSAHTFLHEKALIHINNKSEEESNLG